MESKIMNSKTFLENLDALHKEWDDGTPYTRDGVLYHNGETEEQTIQKWLASDMRIAFLLKEHNSSDSDDLRYWLKDMPTDNDQATNRKRRNRNLELHPDRGNKQIFITIAYILWGLLNNARPYKEANIEDVKGLLNTHPFAMVECKKAPGGARCNEDELERHILTRGNLLEQELRILKPNIIVCMAKGGEIYTNVKHIMFPNSAELIESGREWCYGKTTGELMLNSYHPSYPLRTPVNEKDNEDKYEYCMHNYRAFLQWKENSK